jgi:hypothetical protein
MMKIVLILAAGVCLGYWLGWDDAQTYSKPIYVRAVEAVGGANRQKVKTDPDAQLDSLEKR